MYAKLMNCKKYAKMQRRNLVRYTKHAQMRRQQRAIPDMAIKIIHRYGERSYYKGGESYCINKKSRHRLIEYLKTYMNDKEYRQIIEYLDCYVVVSDGDIITVAHRTQRLKR